MTWPVPPQPKIYHILHVDRLTSVLADGCLYSDAAMIQRPGTGTTIGMGEIKRRRLVLPVRCHPGTRVGDYVPFYFCPRSIMLYVIWQANHPELAYRGGQGPIITLEADLNQVIAHAGQQGFRWAFSLSNAGASYASFRKEAAALGEINWPAVAARDFRPSDVRQAKQAEFLVHGRFPWKLVERIGVVSAPMHGEVAKRLQSAAHRPSVQVRPDWYY